MTAPENALRQQRAPEVVLCPGGPMLIRGASVVQDSDGDQHVVDRPVVALCRCHKTARAPWCDGTHNLLPDKLLPP